MVKGNEGSRVRSRNEVKCVLGVYNLESGIYGWTMCNIIGLQLSGAFKDDDGDMMIDFLKSASRAKLDAANERKKAKVCVMKKVSKMMTTYVRGSTLATGR